MGPRGCWISTYSVGSHGYAQVGWTPLGQARSQMMLCHRVIWIAENGPIEPGWTVDHICKTRRCVRIDHLRLLPNLENARRTSGRDWPLGQCANGHSDEAWRPAGPERLRGYCNACREEAKAETKARDIDAWRAAKRTAQIRYRARRRCRRTDRGDDR